jgi:uncharacterized tellurite resistance protein B-like protein
MGGGTVFDDILRLLTGEPSRPEEGPGGLRLAVAALLVAAAKADDRFDAAERRTVERLLADRFGLTRAEVEDLLRAAETRAEDSPDLFRFVKSFVEQSQPEERVWLIEMLWDVAYADGQLAPDEDALIRRIAGLVHVSDVERGEAHRRARQRAKLGP